MWLFVTAWTVAHQIPLSMGFSRQEYWVGCHALLQGVFPTQGSSPHLLDLLHWQPDSLPLAPPGMDVVRFTKVFVLSGPQGLIHILVDEPLRWSPLKHLLTFDKPSEKRNSPLAFLLQKPNERWQDCPPYVKTPIRDVCRSSVKEFIMIPLTAHSPRWPETGAHKVKSFYLHGVDAWEALQHLAWENLLRCPWLAHVAKSSPVFF